MALPDTSTSEKNIGNRMQIDLLTHQVVAIAKATGEYLLEEQKKILHHHLEPKGINELVSYVDIEAERRIVTALQTLLPESGFIAEEGTAQEKNEKFKWIIDPLDGTTNYLKGIPFYAVSIALMENEKIVLGVVYCPTTNECFTATHNSPAMLNNAPVHVSEVNELSKSFLATGFPYRDFTNFENYIEGFKFLMKNTIGIRRIGSAALDLCYVACGRFDGFYEYALQPWDVAAAALIIEQAGGKVSDFKNGNNYLFGKELIAGNTPIHKALLNVFNL